MFEHLVTYYITMQNDANLNKDYEAGDAAWKTAKGYCNMQDFAEVEIPAYRRGLSQMPALPVDGMLGWTPPVWR